MLSFQKTFTEILDLCGQCLPLLLKTSFYCSHHFSLSLFYLGVLEGEMDDGHSAVFAVMIVGIVLM